MENENKKKLTPEEQERILEEGIKELDEMLEEHERFKEEYGKAFEGLTAEERIKLRVKYYGMVRDFFDSHSELKIKTEDYENEDE